MRIHVAMFGLMLVLCALGAHAQVSADLPDALHVVAASLPDNMPPAPDPSTSAPPDTVSLTVRVQPVAELVAAMAAPTPAVRPKLIDRKFVALGLLTFGLTAMDVEMTQHCLHAGTCYEMNPTLPHSRLGMYAVNTVTNSAVMYFSYRRRKSGKWGWWVAPVVDIGAHVVGVGSNIRFLK